MEKYRLRFTVLDFVLFLILILFVLFYFARSTGMNSVKSDNIHSESTITLRVNDVKKENIKYFIKNVSLFKSENGSRSELGVVSDVRSTPAVKLSQGDGGYGYIVDFSAVDIMLDVLVDSVYDRNCFYSVDGQYYMPALTFEADNGSIKFNCEVVSVKNVS